MGYAETLRRDNPSAYWPGDVTGPSVRDFANGGHDLTAGLRQTAIGPSAALPRALSTKGAAGETYIGSTAAGISASAYTIEGWFRLFGPASTTRVLAYFGNSGANGMGLYIDSSDVLNALHGGVQGRATSYTWNAGDAWHHVMSVYDGTNINVYLDGASILSNTIGAPVAPSATSAVMSVADGTLRVNGMFCQVAIYPFALPASTAYTRRALGRLGGR